MQRHEQRGPAAHAELLERLADRTAARGARLALREQRAVGLRLRHAALELGGGDLVEAAERDAVGAGHLAAPEQREAELAAERGQQQIERHRVDLAGVEAVHQRPARLERAHGAAQPLVVAQQVLVREHALHHGDQLLGLDRLAEVVGRAVAQRLDRAVDRGVGGEQHERHAGRDPARAAEQREAGHALHLEVGEHQIGGLALERRDRGLGAVDALEIDAVAERVAHLLPREPAVVDTQDASLGIR